jgi:integrase
MGRTAYISRREGRYVFKSRFPRCFAPAQAPAFRIALRTSDYRVAVRRAARITSWFMNTKSAETPQQALLALWPRLQTLATTPVTSDDDYVERIAFRETACSAMFVIRGLGEEPEDIAPGWNKHFDAFIQRCAAAHFDAFSGKGGEPIIVPQPFVTPEVDAPSPQTELLALWPQLQAFAVTPIADEVDYNERTRFSRRAFATQLRLRNSGKNPNDVAPGWDTNFIVFNRELARAERTIENAQTPEAQLERRRMELALSDKPILVRPLAENMRVVSAPLLQPPPSRADASKYVAAKMSEVLARFLAARAKEDGDGRAESDIAPMVRFAVQLLGDPIMLEVNGDDLLKLKEALPEIPTPLGFSPTERDLYFRWKTAQDGGWVRQRNGGKTVQLKRPSTKTLADRYAPALVAFWDFAVENCFAYGPVPNFNVKTRFNPPPAERDAFTTDEAIKLFSAPPFTGCHGVARGWSLGDKYVQGFFYWANLIELLCGMRPGEIAQLRCRDILELHGTPHFRFAPFSPEETERNRFDPQPGGARGKTVSAYRWIPIPWLITALGLADRRDAIVAAYVAVEIKKADGKDKVSPDHMALIEREAYEQWLFPDWPVYVKPNGEIKWSHHLTKAFSYGAEVLKIKRKGLTNYSARHFYKGSIDDVQGLSERSRKILFGHSTRDTVSNGYGPKQITEAQSQVAQQLSNRTIWRIALILLRAKRKAERGNLKVVETWRIDERSRDERFQAAMAKRAEQYS